MSDAAAARREARRRRILENSQDRLHRITGKSAYCDTNEGDDLPQRRTPQFTKESLTTPIISPSVYESETVDYEGIGASVSEVQPVNTVYSSDVTTVPEPTVSLLEKLATTKLDIVLLSLLIQLWSAFNTHTYITQHLFMPIFVLEFVKMCILRGTQQSSVVGAMLLLNGISPVRVKTLIKWMQSVQTIVKNCCIYLFVTVIIKFFYGTLLNNDNLSPDDDLEVDIFSEL